MRIDVVSIFPEYAAPLRLSLVGKAIASGLVELGVHDLRSWTRDRHRTVDDTPYGGGAGMVMRPEPWGEALDQLAPRTVEGEPASRLVVLSPSGRVFDQALAEELTGEKHLIFACGRYEGIDARVVAEAGTRMRVDEISIGDYVLNGGEVAALAIIEAVVRLLPGVLGNPESLTEESYSPGQGGLLEYPVYTKPPTWRGLDVPAVLFSGHHARIAAWRREQALARTAERRPELLADRVQVALASAADAGELFTLQQAAFVAEARVNGSLDLPPLLQTLAELEESLGTGQVLVARRAGRLVGSVRAHQVADGAWFVGRLMVAPDLQRQGLGGRLMTEIESLAPAGAAVLRLVTGARSTDNLGFYARRGYVEVSRATPPDELEVVTLEKPLPATAR